MVVSNIFDIEDAWAMEMRALSTPSTGALTKRQKKVGGRAYKVATKLSSTKCWYSLIYSADTITAELLRGKRK